MAKIGLVIVLISMIMISSIHSAVCDFAVSSTLAKGETDAKVFAGPPADGPLKGPKDSSWTDWAKQKISGVENMFSSSAPAAATTTPTAGKV